MKVGEAGTGKSGVIVVICRQFHGSDKKFQVVCSTGIACEVLKDILPGNHKPVLLTLIWELEPLKEIFVTS